MILLTSAVYGVLFSLAESNAEYAEKLANDVRSAEGKIQSFRSENAKFEDVIKVWSAMSEGDRSMSGLRLSVGKSKLEEMVAKYWLSDVKTTFSKPEVSVHPEAKNISVAKSDVALNFNGVSDGMILDFVEAMRTDFPGHIQLKRLTMEKKGDLTRDNVRAIASGTKPPLFSGAMEFVWRDLKYDAPASAAPQAASGL